MAFQERNLVHFPGSSPESLSELGIPDGELQTEEIALTNNDADLKAAAEAKKQPLTNNGIDLRASEQAKEKQVRELQQNAAKVMGFLTNNEIDLATVGGKLEPFNGLWLSKNEGRNAIERSIGARSLGERRPMASVSIYAAGKAKF
ncbi:hypothetical protein KY385_00355 [Candidatus Parcubacteria bacterium]|nr:hypothetical protein [Candidatus Parcubacteria bacterium]